MNGDRLTRPGDGDVAAYLTSINDDRRRTDAIAVVGLSARKAALTLRTNGD